MKVASFGSRSASVSASPISDGLKRDDFAHNQKRKIENDRAVLIE